MKFLGKTDYNSKTGTGYRKLKKRQTGQKQQKDELRALMDDPQVRSWRAIMHAFKSILSELEKGLTQDNCSLSRFQILLLLYFDPRMPAVEIARNMSVTRGNISQFIRRMEEDRLVKSVIEEGRKRPVYSLTGKGKALFERLFPGHIERVKKMTPPLNEKTIRSLSQTPNP